ncbi:glutamyl-Q tRNA(Asp) synthetase [Salinisphaera sp. PC39]|uniref:tRNA glutamyl-Q(34) synthetase GluQRS n=1 Tax=Salinisphaera sp. PC39 TaxID=1304156 RepID=UPI0033412D1C
MAADDSDTKATGAAPPAGRYAPSPTGPLHFGSLTAAVASWLQARSRGAAWYMRMEDIDPRRAVPGAADDILRTLEAYGLTWDGPVLYQSDRLDAYADAVSDLKARGLAFDCGCSRREARTGPAGPEGPIYPGTCRDGLPEGRSPRSVRLRAGHEEIAFVDGVLGRRSQRLDRDVGDFVIRRADGCYAYQLAVVVDDAHQGVGEVVRGSDLLLSTPRQIHLQRCLGLPTPSYAHVPLLVDANGDKLSKSEGATALDRRRPAEDLVAALRCLGQAPPPGLDASGVADVLAWGRRHWRLSAVPACTTLVWDAGRDLAEEA